MTPNYLLSSTQRHIERIDTKISMLQVYYIYINDILTFITYSVQAQYQIALH